MKRRALRRPSLPTRRNFHPYEGTAADRTLPPRSRRFLPLAIAGMASACPLRGRIGVIGGFPVPHTTLKGIRSHSAAGDCMRTTIIRR
jgi:hypothetical protein